MSAKKMTEELYEKICKTLEETHRGLIPICTEKATSKTAFYNHKDAVNIKDEDKKKLEAKSRHDRYTCAREKQIDFLEDQLREVAYDSTRDREVREGINLGGNAIQRDRLKADTIKFILSKLRKTIYGDKLDVTSNGEKIEGISVTIVKPGESAE